MKYAMKLASAALAVCLTAGMLAGCSKTLPTITVNSTEDLDNLKIGVQAGTTGETYVTEHVKTDPSKILSFKTGMDAALDLKNGGIDCIVLDQLPAEAIVRQNDSLKIIDLGLEKEEYAIAVRKGDAALVESINKTIQRMKGDGSYDTLTAAFMPADGSEPVAPAPKAAEGDGTIRLGTNAAFKPFEYVDSNSNIVGFDISMGQEIAADLGKKLEVVDMDFNALIAALASNQIDFIAAGMSVTPKRLENLDFSDPYYASSQVIIVRKEIEAAP